MELAEKSDNRRIILHFYMDVVTYLVFCGRGGIGRRARLRGVWATVLVQVQSAAPAVSGDGFQGGPSPAKIEPA